MEIRKIKTREEKEAAFRVRHEVFVIEQKVDPKEEYDPEDESSTHFVAIENGVVCGTARWRFKSGGTIKLERFAVLEKYRNKGVGTGLLQAVLEDLPFHGEAILHAQLPAINFYKRNGFETYGPEFTEAGIQHYAMKWTKTPTYTESGKVNEKQ